eukprot:COSAG04_NODE_6866_length_1238_cov_2.514486_2_plen_187_part_01
MEGGWGSQKRSRSPGPSGSNSGWDQNGHRQRAFQTQSGGGSWGERSRGGDRSRGASRGGDDSARQPGTSTTFSLEEIATTQRINVDVPSLGTVIAEEWPKRAHNAGKIFAEVVKKEKQRGDAHPVRRYPAADTAWIAERMRQSAAGGGQGNRGGFDRGRGGGGRQELGQSPAQQRRAGLAIGGRDQH